MEIMEQRRFRRVSFVTESFIAAGNQRLKATLEDLSLRGALLTLAEEPPFAPGDSCSVSIALANSNIVLEFEAEVAHLRGMQVGVKIVRIDLDSMTHLRSIIEFNSAEPDEVRKELSFL
ncbi:PilZ domain-containing protein [Geobacter pickeringii]|uniref:Pilus assembly protein PilZ n=1 Tax=Geobacter pickeringii TaxID=345632 RepID=A0A0B5BFU1_9BACT|nr:PilZ domain-containing protein [Geobacter pickeringii]AJE04009.1 pilus assembly protein PilZ [Geobacter pickeringii]